MKLKIAASVTTAILSLLIGFVYYEPVPQDFKSPWKLKAVSAYFRITRFFDKYILRKYENEAEAVLVNRNKYKRMPCKELEALPVDVEHVEFEGIPVMLFIPRGMPSENNPGILHYHGGGWMHLSTDFYQDFSKQLAYATRTIVASVEYRKAPEHVFPASLDDCYNAAIHFISNAKTYRVDPERVALLGDSAGGNLAAAVAMRIRDENFRLLPKLQILVVPALQAIDFSGPSYQEFADNILLSKGTMVAYWHYYALGHAKYFHIMMNNTHVEKKIRNQYYKRTMFYDRILRKYPHSKFKELPFEDTDYEVSLKFQDIIMNPYFAPLMSDDFTHLPKTLIMTAGQDVLRDDGIWYANLLRGAVVNVTHVHYEAGMHVLYGWPFHSDENTLEARGIVGYYIMDNL